MDNDAFFCILGLKVENSNEFYAIYQNRIYSYAQAKKLQKKLRSNNLDFKIYKVVGLVEIE